MDGEGAFNFTIVEFRDDFFYVFAIKGGMERFVFRVAIPLDSVVEEGAVFMFEGFFELDEVFVHGIEGFEGGFGA